MDINNKSYLDNNKHISIIRGESVPISIDFIVDNNLADNDTYSVGYEILKGSNKVIVLSSMNVDVGNDVVLLSQHTAKLIGDYVLRLIVVYGDNDVSKEDFKLRVSK